MSYTSLKPTLEFMNSLKEFFLSFIESAKDRLKNPMIGAFVMAWIAINWRFLAVLIFSGKTIEQKINFIETNYFDINHNLWFPLGFATFYVLVLPYIMALFDWLSQGGISIRKSIAKKHRLTDIRNRQEIAAEEWQLEKIKEGSPDIQAMKERIITLEKLLIQTAKTTAELPQDLYSEDVDFEEVNDNEEEKEEKKKTRRKRRKPTKSNDGTNSGNDEANKGAKKMYLKGFPVMKDIVIRDLAKTEREWILIYALYSSDFGKNVITRDNIWEKYQESNRVTHSRRTNLTNNIKNMIKSGQLKFINDDEMLLTESGVQTATEILNR